MSTILIICGLVGLNFFLFLDWGAYMYGQGLKDGEARALKEKP